ncbi:hypothetical protein HPB50_025361 [Hyalomma asiaticum]|uniref:Uncharacterized protein n=1 Tax=Hyalomma asiaticum TaxID=266040 RepID=A0ACB7RWF1_HYAAI|nr:hypothetical protein HPB50_025361 [Hyalomma asiaticum]
MLGWWNVGRHGVGLRASLESNRLPEHVVRTPRPRSVFSASTASVPIALLPYVIGGHYQKTAPASIPVKKSFPLPNRTARFDSPKIAFSANGFASVRGTKGSTIHASGDLKSPLVNVEAQKTATLRGRRSIEEDPLVVEEAMELVQDLDTDECMLRLSCEISADPPRYGSYGELVAAFISGVGAVGSESAFEDFERAYAQGRSNGVAGCSERYPSCYFDLQGLVALVEPPEAVDVRNSN